MPEPQQLTLAELQLARTLQETKAETLRLQLRELRSQRPNGWQAEFNRVQDELITVATRIGEFNLRIHKLFTGEDLARS